MRHLISIEDLDRAGIQRILDRASSFAEVSGREIGFVSLDLAADYDLRVLQSCDELMALIKKEQRDRVQNIAYLGLFWIHAFPNCQRLLVELFSLIVLTLKVGETSQ